MDAKNSAALIIGGTDGIGLAVAYALAHEGYRVAVLGRDFSKVDRLIASGFSIQKIPVDLLELINKKNPLDTAKEIVEPFPIVIQTSATIPAIRPLIELSWEDISTSIDVNLTSAFLFSKATLATWLSAAVPGTLIHLSSLAAVRPSVGWGPYSATKAGLESLCKTLVAETADSEIRVYCVNPGATRTKMRLKALPDRPNDTLPLPIENVGLYVHLVKDRPSLHPETIDLYNWMEKNPVWKKYGTTLFQTSGLSAVFGK